MFCRLATFLFLVIPFGIGTVWANSVISANPRASFANGNAYLQQGVPLLLEYHGLTAGNKKQSFAYPQRDYEFREKNVQSHNITGSVSSLHYNVGGNAQFGTFTSFDKFAGAGETFVNDKIFFGGFAGISTSGYLDSLDFDLNAALYVERHNHKNPPSTDRQETGWVVWDNKDRNTINYKRIQGHLGINYAWLRLELGYDAHHWGPGFYNNLTLNRQAVPYKYFSIDMVFGPLRVVSFYGSLEIDPANSKIHSEDKRNFYGHRYELALGNATFGMSEIQTIYNNNNGWLFVPVFPLFMEKGNYTERSNNGALAFDANYRIMRTARIYGEFFIDDFDSPISVIKNEYLDSEWALMVGMQVAHDFNVKTHKVEVGSVFEYARLDQFVYAHFEPNEAQFANAGYPLGNQLGPNSQTFDWMLYTQIDNALFIGLRNTWSWKGNVYGSDLNSTWVGGIDKKKDFLGGAKMKYALTPMIAYNTDRWQCSGAIAMFAESKGEINISVRL